MAFLGSVVSQLGDTATHAVGSLGKGIGDLVGGIGNVVGGQTQYQAHGADNLVNPVTNDQAQQAMAQQQQALAQQQQAMQAAQAAGGNTQNAIGQQQALANALASQNGINNQSNVFGQQQALANQLGQMAQGGGPNPALAQLAQTTGANVANQAALMAGQRGAGANAGLIARQIGQQGAATEQNAVGQAATMRANQQLQAVNALQQQQGMLGNLASTQVGQQAGSVGNLNQFTQGAQSLAQNQQGLAQNAQGLAQQNQGQLLNQVNNQNQLNLQNTLAPQQINAGIASNNAANAQKPVLGAISGAGSALTALLAQGGEVSPQMSMDAIKKENYSGVGPRSKIGQHFHKYANGGKVNNMKSGGGVPGKPKIGGARDSYANDTVNAILSPGEIVLPRSVTQSANPAEAAAKFVAAIKAKKGK